MKAKRLLAPGDSEISNASKGGMQTQNSQRTIVLTRASTIVELGEGGKGVMGNE